MGLRRGLKGRWLPQETVEVNDTQVDQTTVVAEPKDPHKYLALRCCLSSALGAILVLLALGIMGLGQTTTDYYPPFHATKASGPCIAIKGRLLRHDMIHQPTQEHPYPVYTFDVGVGPGTTYLERMSLLVDPHATFGSIPTIGDELTLTACGPGGEITHLSGFGYSAAVEDLP